eukprot:scaffold15084_cov21-Tisochrysis_lutea.AAC.4
MSSAQRLVLHVLSVVFDVVHEMPADILDPASPLAAHLPQRVPSKPVDGTGGFGVFALWDLRSDEPPWGALCCAACGGQQA